MIFISESWKSLIVLSYCISIYFLKDLRIRTIKKQSQNCVKAEITCVCTTCKSQLLSALSQLIAFGCNTAIYNFLCTASNANFWYVLLHLPTMLWKVANKAIVLAFAFEKFYMHYCISIDNVCMYNPNTYLLHALS